MIGENVCGDMERIEVEREYLKRRRRSGRIERRAWRKERRGKEGGV